MKTSLSRLCGQLIVGGYVGEVPTSTFLHAVRRGERAGAILFKRNLPSWQAGHNASLLLADAAKDTESELGSPIVAVDQEGGRVQRLGPPLLQLPNMRVFGAAGDEELVVQVARMLGNQLLQVGFNVNFAPVLDVDTNPANPVIGDRSFSRDPKVVARFGVAFALGLQASGVAACGKHFPGHGDTSIDSHLGLPSVDMSLQRLLETELVPFRAAVNAGVDALMSAHIVVNCFDGAQPATLSPTVLHGVLREKMGFNGVVFSDDLEMGAITTQFDVGSASVRALRAGCDVLLICKSEDVQAKVHEALIHEAEAEPQFRLRCEEAAHRCRVLRKCRPLKTAKNPEKIDWQGSRDLQKRMEALFSDQGLASI